MDEGSGGDPSILEKDKEEKKEPDMVLEGASTLEQGNPYCTGCVKNANGKFSCISCRETDYSKAPTAQCTDCSLLYANNPQFGWKCNGGCTSTSGFQTMGGGYSENFDNMSNFNNISFRDPNSSETMLDFFKNVMFSTDCCPSPYSTDRGCACISKDKSFILNTRANNNIPYSEF